MTSTILKTQGFLVLFLMLNSAFMVLEARPLSILETRNSATRRDFVDFFDWLSLGAIKQSGPSPGQGHKFTNTETLGGIKNSGPSSGGAGHKFTNTEILGGIKNSGPSSGGEGHKFTNTMTLGGIKDAGPSPGQGH
ncbi:PAMP-induced secreted peptide 2-like [Gastrolobium bilobum]|uniref:PAMP-induced secreted peptide 2-like n=1 Tax=Gastrolobium bilobum TaxID=150636 RepID=UPI002AB29B5A|nr:PAMP-induced secreted peptide 2-like [Gastrolobium bilobum]